MKVSGLIRLTRPLNAAITFASVWIAGLLAAGIEALTCIPVLWGALAAGLIAAGGNIHNDICDLTIDRVNRPERPLVRGEVSTTTAGILAALLTIIGMGIGFRLGMMPFLITLVAALILAFYNFQLKMTVFWGNLAVSLLTALAFIFGAVLAGNPAGGAVPAIFSLLFHFSREVVKDMEDCEGDSARRGNTFPLKFGLLKSRRLAAAALILLFIIVPLPYLAKMYKFGYFVISLLGVEIPLIWAIFGLLSGRIKNLRHISLILKLSMIAGLAALFAGL